MKLGQRKEDIFNSLSEWHTDHANILEYCGIPSIEIRNWIEPSNTMVNLREALKYAKKDMIPAVDKFIIIAGRDMSAWRMLKLMDPGNDKLKTVKQEAKKVLAVWDSRPKGKLIDAKSGK